MNNVLREVKVTLSISYPEKGQTWETVSRLRNVFFF